MRPSPRFGAELERRRTARSGEPLSQLRVGGNTADDGDALAPRLLRGLQDTVGEGPHDRALVGGGEVGAPALELVGARSRTAYSRAVFRPEKEKSSPGTRATGNA